MVVVHGDPEGVSIVEAKLPIGESEKHTASDRGEAPAVQRTHGRLGKSTEGSRLSPRNFMPMEICQDSGLFDWSAVDVPGSPELSRLLKSLEIESAVQIPPLSLNEPEPSDVPCLTRLEIQEVFNKNNGTANKDFHRTRISRVRKRSAPPEIVSRREPPHYPWRNLEFAFCGYTSSPLNEIYVWPPPPSRKASRRATHLAAPTKEYLGTQEKELQIKLAKLRNQFGESNPAVIAAMGELAKVVCELEKYTEAESMYQEIESLCHRTLGPHHIWTLISSQNIILSLKGQGQFLRAKNLNDSLRSTICKLFPPHHQLTIRVSKVDAWLAEVLGETEACERARREILQITLVSYGPRHPDTMQALSLLGHTISQTGTEWGGLLLRTAIELSLQDPYQDAVVNCAMMVDLAYALNFNRAYEESYQVATNAQERFNSLLGHGQTHMLLIGLEEQRARSLLEIRRLDESEKLVRNLANVYETRNLGTHNSDVSNAWCGLGNVLSQMGHREEATQWYKKYIEMRVSSDRGIDSAFIATGYKLVYCYQEQGRLDDALKVYYQMLDKFPKSRQDAFTTAWMRHIESEIRSFEAHMEMSMNCSTDSSDWEIEGTEYDWDSSDTEDDEGLDEIVNAGRKRIPDVELEVGTDIKPFLARTVIL